MMISSSSSSLVFVVFFTFLLITICNAINRNDFDMRELYIGSDANLSFAHIDGGVWKQGWNVQYDASQWNATHPLEVFVLPHSHVDAGWLKTFDEYYQQQTRSIITSVVSALSLDERRHFVWADIGFFQRWWDEATPFLRDHAREIVQRGQLEFVTGAWVTTDEANARYPEMLEQVLEGHDWLRRTFNVRPRFGWSIDPFGHSPTMAYLLQRVGFDGIVINRVHYAVKKMLAQNQALEFYWQQRWQQPVNDLLQRAGAAPLADDQFFTPRFHHSAQILTHMFPFYSYDVPHTCGPEPAVCCEFDFARSGCPWPGHHPTPITPENLQIQAEKLLDQYRKKSTLFRSGAVLIPVGDDFRYVTPGECSGMFNNYQKVFDYINTNRDRYHAHVRFANLSSYFDMVQSRLQRRSALPVVRGDFFTYADRDEDYWSGYFTSRPFYKRLGRRAQATVRAAEVLHSLTHVQLPEAGANEPPSLRGSLLDARRTIGIFQHHDAVTGTAKTHVNDDYGRMLHRARHDMRNAIRDSLHAALRAPNATAPLVSVAKLSEGEQLLAHDEDSARDANKLPLQIALPLQDGTRAVVLFNALPYERREAVSVPVEYRDARVLDADGVPVAEQQLQPNWGNHESQMTAAYRLHFVATLPALGYTTYFVERDSEGEAARHATVSVSDNGVSNRLEDPRIAQEYANAGFHVTHVSRMPDSVPLGTAATVDRNGMLRSLLLNTDGDGARRQLAVREAFGAYVTSTRTQSSGAYLIDPTISRFEALHGEPHVRIVRGPVLDEVIVTLADGKLPFQRVARVYHHDPTFVDVTHRFAMNNDISDREVVVRFDASAAVPTVVNHTFYSDSNGFQMHRRDYVTRIPRSANIYPCAAEAFVVDEPTATRFSVLSPQAHAVFSWDDGVLEFIVDRRTSGDDARGVTQALNDNLETESHMRIVLERTPSQVPLDRSTNRAARLARSLEHHVHAFYASPSAPRTPDAFMRARFTPTRSFVDATWPDDVVLETLRVYDEDESKLVVHVRRMGTAAGTRTPIALTAPIFAGLDVVNSERYALSMMHRDDSYKHGDPILLKPMEIECYLLTVARVDRRPLPKTTTTTATTTTTTTTAADELTTSTSKSAPYNSLVSFQLSTKARQQRREREDGDDDNNNKNGEPDAEAATPCPPTKASESSTVLFVAGAMLCLQGLVALFSLGPSRMRNALAIVLFIATVMWLQMLVFGSFKHH
jgi:alpha-mannosidase II